MSDSALVRSQPGIPLVIFFATQPTPFGRGLIQSIQPRKLPCTNLTPRPNQGTFELQSRPLWNGVGAKGLGTGGNDAIPRAKTSSLPLVISLTAASAADERIRTKIDKHAENAGNKDCEGKRR